MSEHIEVLGARVHNLKNIDVAIPKNKLVVITGLSGSGKSSLAFDTIFAEGQRRYMESFSAYARQFMGDLERPDVDKITGLSPVISIEQKTTNRNPRSTVGTVTEVYDFMRLLYARIGTAHSYLSGKAMTRFSEEEILQHIYTHLPEEKIILLAPVVRGRKGHYRELFEQLQKQGYLKVRIDGVIVDLKPKMQLDRYKIHDIELVVDRLKVDEESKGRLSQSLQKALQLGKGLLFVQQHETNKLLQYSKHLMDIEHGISYEDPSPNTFSFNSPYGACPACKGLGTVHTIDRSTVTPDLSKSIAAGGIAPMKEAREAQSYQIAAKYARKHKIDLNKPVGELSATELNLMLYANEEGTLTYVAGEGSAYTYLDGGAYEGVLNMMMRWFNESPSDYVRDWAEQFMQLDKCPECKGQRLKPESLSYTIYDKNIAQLAEMPLSELHQWFSEVNPKLNKKQQTIAKDILKEIIDRVGFLIEVGLHYLILNRPTRTLSGGESQRIRLATQIGSKLMGITYILDEPSIGLHQRDNHQLITALQNLRDGGNSVLVVEHDKDIMLASDYVFDMGPAAGIHGGKIVAQGTPKEFLKSGSITAQYLNHKMSIAIPEERRKGNGHLLVLKGATGNNLKNVSIEIPLGTLTCVTGVSGSGKSTLINETLYPILSRHCYPQSKMQAMPYKSIEGLEHIDKVIEIDQSPIGRTPRSNPATYCGFFNDIRQLFAMIPEAKIRGYTAGRFSFNVKGGRCEECQGGGTRVIEMNFLPDVYVPCEKCQGKRYNRETLEVRYKGKSIYDILEMTVEDAVEFFVNMPSLHRKVKTLKDVGLGYITLGQSAVTLSGGEAQRVKLATELSKKDTGKTIYILDEPSTGLHFEDIKHLLAVLNKLVERGNTIVVIEHNLDIVKVADYIVDIGPEGGHGGGTVVAKGTPEQIAKNKKSHTGTFLALEL
ncbi:excinuclease ABC subunit UvrA [Taibaiella sp. KBW10]|uniref:excinuclease ABC subunit UvrA n=1 Tax=Taibaiella sp. KBW10 TaxID=2153357 RepID=UPI000F5A695A|nr:excinuclease ABC subunit UvrA [Taibaiella sp. KBW10]RQO31666.1 excinuclease ABC subunit UvrA [Taibaiella sp. KBW10]